MSKVMRIGASLLVASLIGVATAVPPAYARHRVDCAKVMKDLKTHMTEKATAEALHISRSSVYRCKVKARKAEKAEKKNAPKSVRHVASAEKK